MAQIMPQPWKHPKTGAYYFRKVVPEPLRPAIGRREFRINLGKDLQQAKLKYPGEAARVDALLSQARGGPTVLTHQQIVALAGEWYRRQLAAGEANPGNSRGYDADIDHLQRADEHGKGRAAVANDVDELLETEGLTVDRATRDQLSDRIFWLRVNLNNTLKLRSWGDYSPDPKLVTLPAWIPPNDAGEAPKGPTFDALMDAWELERAPPKRTLYEWKRAIKRLEDFVGHSEPARLTKAEMVSWKDALLASGKTTKTVSNHLLVTKALFNWAVKNERMPVNPADGVSIIRVKAAAKSRLPYGDEEARLLLSTARQNSGARRWVPWVLAFTGARLEEVCQALVKDVRKDGSVWFLDINADDPGKTLKNVGSVRRVPLHPALISEGFAEYLSSVPKGGLLFPDLKPDRFGKKGGSFSKWYGRWARGLGITDPRLVLHSWRHRFKDLCKEAGIQKPIHDALTGHSSRDVGDGYGMGYSLAVLAEAMGRIGHGQY